MTKIRSEEANLNSKRDVSKRSRMSSSHLLRPAPPLTPLEKFLQFTTSNETRRSPQQKPKPEAGGGGGDVGVGGNNVQVPSGHLLNESSFMNGMIEVDRASPPIKSTITASKDQVGKTNSSSNSSRGGNNYMLQQGSSSSSSSAVHSGVVKGQWTCEEDSLLVRLVKSHGVKKWSQIAKMLAGRIGKQCRERWHNHLRPDIKNLKIVVAVASAVDHNPNYCCYSYEEALLEALFAYGSITSGSTTTVMEMEEMMSIPYSSSDRTSSSSSSFDRMINIGLGIEVFGGADYHIYPDHHDIQVDPEEIQMDVFMNIENGADFNEDGDSTRLFMNIMDDGCPFLELDSSPEGGHHQNGNSSSNYPCLSEGKIPASTDDDKNSNGCLSGGGYLHSDLYMSFLLNGSWEKEMEYDNQRCTTGTEFAALDHHQDSNNNNVDLMSISVTRKREVDLMEMISMATTASSPGMNHR